MATLDDTLGKFILLHNGLRHFFDFEESSSDWCDKVSALGPVPSFFTGGGTPISVAGLNGNAARMESASSEYIVDTADLFANGLNPLGSGDFTLVGWWKLRSLSSIQDCLWRWDAALNQREIFINYNNTNTAFNLQASSNGSTVDINIFNLATSGIIVLNNWNFIVLRRRGALLDFNVNQSGVQTTNIGAGYAFHPSTRTLKVGAAENSGAPFRFSDIDIDQLGLWDKALTDAQLDELYNNGLGLAYPFLTLSQLSSLASGIISAYRMGQGATQQAFDVIAASRNDLTNNGSPNPVEAIVGSGTEFNGTTQYFSLLDGIAQDWEIGNREWSMHIRFKIVGTGTQTVLIGKNNESGVGGAGSEWELRYDPPSHPTPPRLNFRVLYNTSPFESTVETSGSISSPLDDQQWHSACAGYIPGSGTWLILDNEARGFTPEIVTGTHIGNATFMIARKQFAGNPGWLRGMVDSVHLWHRALTEEEARTLNGF